MARYRVIMVASVDTPFEVEADSPGQAKEIAEDTFEGASLCHQCVSAMNPPDVWVALYAVEA